MILNLLARLTAPLERISVLRCFKQILTALELTKATGRGHGIVIVVKYGLR